jgi:hypothetical protein
MRWSGRRPAFKGSRDRTRQASGLQHDIDLYLILVTASFLFVPDTISLINANNELLALLAHQLIQLYGDWHVAQRPFAIGSRQSLSCAERFISANRLTSY